MTLRCFFVGDLQQSLADSSGGDGVRWPAEQRGGEGAVGQPQSGAALLHQR